MRFEQKPRHSTDEVPHPVQPVRQRALVADVRKVLVGEPAAQVTALQAQVKWLPFPGAR